MRWLSSGSVLARSPLTPESGGRHNPLQWHIPHGSPNLHCPRTPKNKASSASLLREQALLWYFGGRGCSPDSSLTVGGCRQLLFTAVSVLPLVEFSSIDLAMGWSCSRFEGFPLLAIRVHPLNTDVLPRGVCRALGSGRARASVYTSADASCICRSAC